MDFLVLGPLAALRGGHRVDLGSRRRERCLLGLLLLEPRRAISIDRLIDLLWEGEPPANARGTLSSHVSRLRGMLDPERNGRNGVQLCTRGDGYVVEVATEAVDAHRFRALTDTASTLADPSDRSRVLAEALALWRGPLLADSATDWLRRRVGVDLTELRLAAAESKLEADLACGRHAAVVAEMAGLVSDNPFRERLVSLFMLALYRSGRQTDALALYHTVRERLADELGLDPGSALRSMHEAILRRDPELEPARAGSTAPVAGAAAGGPAAPAAHGPAQLPAPPRHFTGRSVELTELDALLAGDSGDQTPIVATIVGPAGVGKTALALRWATAARVRFPEGQLYLNLRGFTLEPPMRPIDGLGLLLRALGLPAERIPADTEEAAAAYRSLVADRRMLILLDNAYDVDQVRPLLPGGSACAVVVTSRNRLGGLTAVEGAHRLALTPLSPDEAATLLRTIVGAARTDAEPAATAELAEVCGRLPLALRVAAANLSDDGRAAIGDHVSMLRSGRLAALSVDDDSHATVRVALDVSYLRLPADARRMFALLSAVPGGVTGRHGAAALAGTTLAEADRLTESLGEAHLLDEPRPGRYTMHDLVRLYAAERLDSDRPAGERAAAVERLLAWHLAVADVVSSLGTPHRERPPLAPSPLADPELVPARLEEALALLDGERAGLVPLTRLALDRGDHQTAWHLAHQLAGYFQMRGDGPDSIAVYEHGLAAAELAGDATGTASLHNSLGVGHGALRQWAAATDHLLRARDFRRDTGDRDGEARVLLNLGGVLMGQARYDESLRAYHRSLQLSVAVGQHRRVPHLWNNIGMVYLGRGDYEAAAEHTTRALELFRGHDDVFGESTALDTLGRVYAAMGDPDTALRIFTDALAAMRGSGNGEAEGETLANIGAIHLGRGDVPAAIEHLESAARCHRGVNNPHRESVVRRQLAEAHLAAGDRDAALSELDVAQALRARTPDAAEEVELRRVKAAHARSDAVPD